MNPLARFALLASVALTASLRAEDKPANQPPEGFTALFNGKNLDGWKATGKADAWAAEDGVIVCKGGGGGYLLTEKEYGDFEFRCEYQWSKEGGNSGVAPPHPGQGRPRLRRHGDPTHRRRELGEGPQVQARRLPAHRVDLRRAAGQTPGRTSRSASGTRSGSSARAAR